MNLIVTINETGNAILGTIVTAESTDGTKFGAWASGPTQDGALHAARKAILKADAQVYQVIYQIAGREVN